MDLVRQQIAALQDTHGTESTSLTFTGGGLHAVRPEELSDVVSHVLLIWKWDQACASLWWLRATRAYMPAPCTHTCTVCRAIPLPR